MATLYIVLFVIFALSILATFYFLTGVLFPKVTVKIEAGLRALFTKGESMIIVTEETERAARRRNLVFFALFLTLSAFVKAILNQLALLE